jgi:hypothetical protein
VTYLAPTVASPAVNPWDVAAIAARALDVLRLEEADDDAGRINLAVAEAVGLLDAELDLEVAYVDTASIPAPVNGAAVTLTVELYRRKDAPFGVTDSWSPDGAVLRLSSDVLRGVRSALAPFVGRRGIA